MKLHDHQITGITENFPKSANFFLDTQKKYCNILPMSCGIPSPVSAVPGTVAVSLFISRKFFSIMTNKKFLLLLNSKTNITHYNRNFYN